MDIFQSFIMGLVQGLTEFLPVSSSGHMILAAKLLGTAPSLATELVFHIATLAAVIVFYRKKILSLLKKPLQKTTFLLLISTVATAPVALLLRDAADEMQDGRLLPLFFTLTAVLLVLSDRLFFSILSIIPCLSLTRMRFGLFSRRTLPLLLPFLPYNI